MAIQTIGHSYLPQLIGSNIANVTLDASGEKVAQIFQAPKTGNIDRVCIRIGAMTTATNTDMRLETVDGTTGEASGTLFGANTNGTMASGSITANTWVETTLTAAAAVTKGQVLALAVTPSGTPNYQVNRVGGISNFGFPYSSLFTASWAKNSATLLMAVRYDDGTYVYIEGIFPYSAISATNINSGTTPDEVGNKFTLPFPARITGVTIDSSTSSNASEGTFRIYDNSNNVLASLAVDFTNINGGANAFIFATPYTIAKDTVYRVAVEFTTATNRAVRSYDVASTSVAAAQHCGNNFMGTSRTNGGSWSDETVVRWGVGIIVDGFDDGASGGGGGASSYGFVG